MDAPRAPATAEVVARLEAAQAGQEQLLDSILEAYQRVARSPESFCTDGSLPEALAILRGAMRGESIGEAGPLHRAAGQLAAAAERIALLEDQLGTARKKCYATAEARAKDAEEHAAEVEKLRQLVAGVEGRRQEIRGLLAEAEQKVPRRNFSAVELHPSTEPARAKDPADVPRCSHGGAFGICSQEPFNRTTCETEPHLPAGCDGPKVDRAVPLLALALQAQTRGDQTKAQRLAAEVLRMYGGAP